MMILVQFVYVKWIGSEPSFIRMTACKRLQARV